MVAVDYGSLGGILEKLQTHPDVQASPIVLERIQTAIRFHKSLGTSLENFFTEYFSMGKKMAELLEDPRVKFHGEIRQGLLGEYEQIISNRYVSLIRQEPSRH
jgi:hypothetical protein